MTELKSKVLEFFTKSKSKMSYATLKKALKLSPEEQECLKEILNELEISGKIYLNDYDEYMLFPQKSKMSVGVIKLDAQRRPFVLSGSNMIFIPDNCLNGAITGDIVLVQKNTYNKIPNSSNIVKKIIKRQNGELIFECRSKNGRLELVPYNSPFRLPLSLSKKDEARLIEGTRMMVKVSQDAICGFYPAEIISIVGHKDDPDLDIKTIASSFGIRTEYPEDVLEEVEKIPTYVSTAEIEERVANGGRDLRDQMIFTIDGKRTKDIDDAVSVYINERGNFVLGVHIADVGYYVKEGSAIYREAMLRGNTYYLIDSAIHMLHPKLSSGICSLNPGVDRLAMSCEVEITPDGKVVNYEIFDSIIRSRKKMVYEEINDIFDNGAPKRDYGPYYTNLQLMFKLSAILSKRKEQRGYITFGDDEIKISVDAKGIPIGVRLVKRGSSEKLIENLMLTANEMVGSYPEDTFIKYVDLPWGYRTHGLPNETRIAEIVEYLNNCGYRIRPVNYKNPFAIQALLKSLSQYPEFPIISDLLLRGLSRARYSTNNTGHFGLALQHYTHFTSPIRRSSDLQTHINIRKYRAENLMELDPAAETAKMNEVCMQASRTERVADQAERAVNAYKMAELMESHIGDIYNGMVTYISRHGISVRTDEHVTGSVSMTELTALGFTLDSTFTKLINTETGDRLKLGDTVSITVKYANKETRKIQFSLNYDLNKIKGDKEKVYRKKAG